MKKYRLKQWYPSLDEEWDTTHRYEYQSSTGYVRNMSMQHCVKIYKKELHSDFWEEVEEPLFVTDDGVEVFDRNTIVYNVRNNTLAKIEINAVYLSKHDFEHKVFLNESNADEYILRNKRVFSYEDFIRWGNVPYERVIMQLAIERSKE